MDPCIIKMYMLFKKNNLLKALPETVLGICMLAVNAKVKK